MSSLPVCIATEVPSCEPETFDSLDYDDWEGQFEFVGNNSPTLNRLPATVTGSTSSTTSSFRSSSSIDNSQDDLNLSHYPFVPQSKRPILIDEETFLSIQPTSEYGDVDDHEVLNSISGAPSGYFIENALKDLHFTNGLAYKEHLDNANHSLSAKLLANKHLENRNNIRNKLISTVDLEALLSNKQQHNNNNNDNSNLHHQLDRNNGHNRMDNQFSAELHDNLAEQVSLSNLFVYIFYQFSNSFTSSLAEILGWICGLLAYVNCARAITFTLRLLFEFNACENVLCLLLIVFLELAVYNCNNCFEFVFVWSRLQLSVAFLNMLLSLKVSSIS